MPQELSEQANRTRAMIARNFSDELKAQRWSKRSISVALGLTHTYVNNRANGSVEMSGSDLALFADFLAVPVTRFFAPVPEEEATVIKIDTTKRTKAPQKDYVGAGSAVVDMFAFRASAGVA